jgi:signal transduction histidine kinase
MHFTLKQKIALAFLLSSIVVMGMMFSVTQYIIQKEFSKYIISTHEKQDREILNYLAETLNRGGLLNTDTLWPLEHQSMMEGFLVVVYDRNKTVIWDNKESYTAIYGNEEGSSKLHELVYPIRRGTELIGYLSISRNFSNFFSPEDIGFQRALYSGLLTVAAASILIALFFSYMIGGQLSSPIIHIKEAANQLREGRLGARAEMKSSTREISELADSINHLGASLERQETLRRRLTSDISHELRTPLNIIQSQLEAYIDGIWQPTDERLKSTHAEVLRLSHLVKDLERLTELDESQIQLVKSSVLLNRLLRDLSIQIQPMYHEKEMTLVLKEEAEAEIFADSDKIRQLFLNLLVNAYKYTPEHGMVEIMIGKDEKNAVVQIKDNGIGISPEELPNIFERFYRTEISRNRETGGAGLGLSIVQSIVKAHNGSIHVESEKDRGTQFTVYLPL